MHKIISLHDNATAIFGDEGVIGTVKTRQVNPVQFFIDYLEAQTDAHSAMYLGLVDEAIANDMLYYTINGVKHRYELI